MDKNIEKTDYFNELNNLNLNDKIKQKMGLNYLSWAYAWQEIRKFDPDATYTILRQHMQVTDVIKNDELGTSSTYTYDLERPYFSDGRSCWVEVEVTIKGVTYLEVYPIMDLKNNAVKTYSVTSTDVNKALQRAFVKCCARHGLGLYVYAGEDLPEAEKVPEPDVTKLVNQAATTTIPSNFSESDFNTLKAQNINWIKTLGTLGLSEKTCGEIAESVQRIHNGKRASLLDYNNEEDKVAVVVANAFLSGLFEKKTV